LRKVSSKTVYYSLSPFHEPAAEMEPCETILVETRDALGGVITAEQSLERLLAEGALPQFFNPVTGPIYVNGTSRGDTLVVEILDIKLSEKGTTVNLPGFGGLTAPYLQENLSAETRISEIRNGSIHFPLADGRTVQIPIKPLIGTIGTAPQLEAQLSTKPDRHGGNMDCPDVTVGCRLLLPVFVKGALLFMGDVHAAQGDGEIGGVAIESSSEITVRVNVLKKRNIRWPRIVSEDEIMTVCSSASLEHAVKAAFTELVLWLEDEFELPRMDAYMLCTQVAKARICQVVNERYTVAAKFPRSILSQRKNASLGISL
jgi:amidase